MGRGHDGLRHHGGAHGAGGISRVGGASAQAPARGWLPAVTATGVGAAVQGRVIMIESPWKLPTVNWVEANDYIISVFSPLTQNKRKFMDGALTLVLNRPVLDIYAFDDYLHEVYGNYEENGLSMYELLVKQYGQEFAEFIKKLL
jgi:hypothetical protein